MTEVLNKKGMRIIFGLLLLLSACRPDKTPPVGSSMNIVAQMAGTWKISAVTQTDLQAARYGFADPSRPDVNLITQDVTTVAPYTDFTLQLNEDASMNPKDFSATPGDAPAIISLTSGSWNLDNAQFPQYLQLFTGSGTDTTKLTLGSLNNLSSGILILQLMRYSGSKAVLQYNYTFNKIK